MPKKKNVLRIITWDKNGVREEDDLDVPEKHVALAKKVTKLMTPFFLGSFA